MAKLNYEAECIRGLETFVADELNKIGGKVHLDQKRPGALRFSYGKSLTRFEKVRIVNQIFSVHYFSVPRPKALMGSQNYRQLIQILENTRLNLAPHSVNSFRLEAAGKDSAVFQRLIQKIGQDLRLPHDPKHGDLFLRVMPAKQTKTGGWELLVRQSVRPLATRAWRQFNYKGALAAPIAAVMLHLAQVEPSSRVLNLMSGSGTLLAENQHKVACQVGIDLNGAALIGAQQNLLSAPNRSGLILGDGVHLPLAAASFDVILSDLPWGQLVGNVAGMQELYPAVLAEAFRVATRGGRFVVVTQLKKQMQAAVHRSAWKLEQKIDLKMDRVSPAIYRLRK